ncbi:uncharacterized protein B0I36DRAFT_324393 [Microdochium trichocladiopsis]|uniref:Secreted protein n=1 Tax=Microdochium trichocladiopsis TaxID=1682393 RepID=A0A9P8YAH1_9PEZI|nr:uncharacterized protein B0I36DRAFT_324393 [Microdochium trichocladiopsis]KAH7031665.1 hypothetical protein B0I36DRAFT_324393 [Microdochium trichocladiopsis]
MSLLVLNLLDLAAWPTLIHASCFAWPLRLFRAPSCTFQRPPESFHPPPMPADYAVSCKLCKSWNSRYAPTRHGRVDLLEHFFQRLEDHFAAP